MRPTTRSLLSWHRLIATLGSVLLLFVAITGTGIELADMRALLARAPATDPDMLMMRQHIRGGPGFVVVTPTDYSAPALPATFDGAAALVRTAALARKAVPGAPVTLVEVRTAAGRPIGHARVAGRDLGFNLADGRMVPQVSIPRPVTGEVPGSTRHFFKKLHQFRFVGPAGSFLNGVAGLLFAGLIVTGLWQFFRVLRARASRGRRAPFWRGGGTWRELHRAVAVAAGIVVVWLVGTGILMSIDDIGGSLGRLGWVTRTGAGRDRDVSAPMTDAELPGMARVTLAAFHRSEPGVGVRVLQLRRYAVYRQGVVVAADEATSQYVYNADTGAAMSMQEKGYPDTGFPYGWEWHQRMKQLHRGDFFGMAGRWLMTLGGLSLVYLSVSGIVMYVQMWRRRRANGKASPIWQ